MLESPSSRIRTAKAKRRARKQEPHPPPTPWDTFRLQNSDFSLTIAVEELARSGFAEPAGLLFTVPIASDAVISRRPLIGAPFTVPGFAPGGRRNPLFVPPAFGPTFGASAPGSDPDSEADPSAGPPTAEAGRRVSGPVALATRELLTNALTLSCFRCLLPLSVLLPADDAGSGYRRDSCDRGSTSVCCSQEAAKYRRQVGDGQRRV